MPHNQTTKLVSKEEVTAVPAVNINLAVMVTEVVAVAPTTIVNHAKMRTVSLKKPVRRRNATTVAVEVVVAVTVVAVTTEANVIRLAVVNDQKRKELLSLLNPSQLWRSPPSSSSSSEKRINI